MMKALRTYSTPEQAYIVRGMLDDAGIAAQVQDTGTNSVFPSLGGGTGGATLLVDEKDAPRAKELIAAHGD